MILFKFFNKNDNINYDLIINSSDRIIIDGRFITVFADNIVNKDNQVIADIIKRSCNSKYIMFEYNGRIDVQTINDVEDINTDTNANANTNDVAKVEPGAVAQAKTVNV